VVSIPPKKGAILLVEEILLMRTLIEQAGPYQVTSAQDGNKGLELLLGGGWDLALIDFNLPGMDGIELIQKGRERHPGLPMMAVTGSTSSLMIDGAIRAGADYVLNKPVDRDELLRKIREFVKVEGGGAVDYSTAGTPEAAPVEAAPAAADRSRPAAPSPPPSCRASSVPREVSLPCRRATEARRDHTRGVSVSPWLVRGNHLLHIVRAISKTSRSVGTVTSSRAGENGIGTCRAPIRRTGPSRS